MLNISQNWLQTNNKLENKFPSENVMSAVMQSEFEYML